MVVDECLLQCLKWRVCLPRVFVVLFKFIVVVYNLFNPFNFVPLFVVHILFSLSDVVTVCLAITLSVFNS